MGTPNEWRGDSTSVTDVWTLTVTGPATGSGSITVPIGTKTVSVTYVNTETADAVATRLFNALAASPAPEFGELGYLYPGGGVITATGKRAGVPVAVGALIVTAATGIAVARSNAVPATGPNFANNVNNWSLAHLPNVGEDAVFRGGPAVLYGLAGMYAGAVDATRFYASFTAGAGLSARNVDGSTAYVEYRTRALDLSASGGLIYVGEGAGAGASRINIKIGDDQHVLIYNTGRAPDDSTAAVEIGTTGSGNPELVSVFKGSVAIGNDQPASQSIDVVSCVGQSIVDVNGPAAAVNVRNGSVRVRGAVTLATVQGGEYIQTAGTLATVAATGGIVRLSHPPGGVNTVCHFAATGDGDPPYLDVTQTDIARTLGAGSYFRGGAFILDPYEVCALVGVEFSRASLQASDIGDSFSIDRT